MVGFFPLRNKSPFPLFRFRPLLCALIAATLLLGTTYLLQQYAARVFAQNERVLIDKQVREIAANLSASILIRLNLSRSLNAFVVSQPFFTAQEFHEFASTLKAGLTGVISLQLAPGGVVTYLTDTERSQSVLADDLLADTLRRALANKPIRERSDLITDSIELLLGGRSIIGIEPIFFYDSANDSEIFWGYATVLIDLDALLNDTTFAELTKDLELAIRSKASVVGNGNVFIGTASTFNAALAIVDIPLPNTRWQVAAIKKTADLTDSLIRSAGAWLIASIAAYIAARLTYLIVDRPYQLNLCIKRATESLIQEVQHRIHAEQKMRHMAQHDQLTGLPNRYLFDELSRQAMATAQREGIHQAFLFIDIDGFKKINDSLGHTAGDELLKQISARLVDRVRKSDIVARFGGDEFVVFLTEKCDIAGAKKTALEIIGVIAKPFLLQQGEANVSASVGIALYPNHGSQTEELLKKSDAAMYIAKKNGKNSFRLAEN